MKMSLIVVLAVYAAVSVAALIAYGADKWKAKRGKWRIPEKVLLLLTPSDFPAINRYLEACNAKPY